MKRIHVVIKVKKEKYNKLLIKLYLCILIIIKNNS